MDPRKKLFLQKMPVVLVVLAVFCGGSRSGPGERANGLKRGKAPHIFRFCFI